MAWQCLDSSCCFVSYHTLSGQAPPRTGLATLCLSEQPLHSPACPYSHPHKGLVDGPELLGLINMCYPGTLFDSELRLTRMKDLSMAWKRLASAGSCFTMSPPEKTASMYIHRLCTPSQPSTHSPTVPSRFSQAWTSSRKGAAYLCTRQLSGFRVQRA